MISRVSSLFRIPSRLRIRLSSGESARGSDFAIDEWSFASGVYDGATGEHDFQGFITVQNPFQASHSAVVGGSTATTTYDFAWAEQFGSLLIQASHETEGVESGDMESFSSGFIWITPSEDILLTIDAAYSYDLPDDPMTARLETFVTNADSPVSLFDELVGYDTGLGVPASGTLTINGDVILPAGETWVFGYSMEIDTFSGTGSAVGTSSGHISLTITPEPTTASLLALGAFMLLRRGRRTLASHLDPMV